MSYYTCLGLAEVFFFVRLCCAENPTVTPWLSSALNKCRCFITCKLSFYSKISWLLLLNKNERFLRSSAHCSDGNPRLFETAFGFLLCFKFYKGFLSADTYKLCVKKLA